jgi:hypothetical protein
MKKILVWGDNYSVSVSFHNLKYYFILPNRVGGIKKISTFVAEWFPLSLFGVRMKREPGENPGQSTLL